MECSLGSVYTFLLANGCELPLRQVQLLVRQALSPDQPTADSRVFIKGQVTHQDFLAIEATQAFHLEAEARGALFGGRFSPHRYIDLDLLLCPAITAPLVAMAEDVFDIASRMRESDLCSPIRAAHNYYLLCATQSTAWPQVRVGLQTIWQQGLSAL